MRNNALYMLLIFLIVSCDKETIDGEIPNAHEAKISIITLLCNTESNPGCTGILSPAMGATVRLYNSEEERENRFNEVAIIYTDHEGKKTATLAPGYYYIYTLHMGRETYTQENAPVNSNSFHEVIIFE